EDVGDRHRLPRPQRDRHHRQEGEQRQQPHDDQGDVDQVPAHLHRGGHLTARDLPGGARRQRRPLAGAAVGGAARRAVGRFLITDSTHGHDSFRPISRRWISDRISVITSSTTPTALAYPNSEYPKPWS